MNLKGYRVIARIQNKGPGFLEYTGPLVKTLVYALNPEVSQLRGIKGIFSVLMVSPLFTVRNDHGLGDLVSVQEPVRRVEEKGEGEPEPVQFDGEYIFHLGGVDSIVDSVVKSLEGLPGVFSLRYQDNIIYFEIEKIVDVTREVIEKAKSLQGRVRFYLKSPTQIYNIYKRGKLPKFMPSAPELLMTPYALLHGVYTLNTTLILNALEALGGMIETWYSLRTLKPIQIIFKDKKQINLGGYVTYVIEEENPRFLKEVKLATAAAELVGVGRSRMNGFGTVIFTG